MLEVLYNNDNVLWQMSLAEKMAIHYILDRLPKRRCAIEIGTYCGGSLQVLSKYFDKVYSLDISHDNVVDKNSYNYNNVQWVTGDSKETLPIVLEELEEEVNFILIDGDHSYDAVQQDLQNILSYKPTSEIVVLMHDSWYNEVRQVLNEMNWDECPTVEFVEKDLVMGDIHDGVLIGGLAMIRLVPRKQTTTVISTYSYTYDIISSAL